MNDRELTPEDGERILSHVIRYLDSTGEWYRDRSLLRILMQAENAVNTDKQPAAEVNQDGEVD